MAAGWPTKANYATGDVLSATNMNDLSGTVNYIDPTSATDGQVLTRDAASSGKVKWATPSAGSSGSSNVAGKNAVINSNFLIWQRGTSIAATGGSGVYTADRWSCYNASYTVSQQDTSDTTNLPFIAKCARVQRRLAETSVAGVNFVQPLESINSKPFIGKVATLSFYARAGANYSSASSALSVYLLGGTGTDQNPNNTYTGQTSIISQTATLTTTWQRFSYTTGTIGTTVNELAVQLTSIGVGTALTNDYFEVTGVQLEIASAVSAYSPNASTQALELAACQRYYFRSGASGGVVTSAYNLHAQGYEESATSASICFKLPVTMRVAPTAIEYANVDIYDSTNRSLSALTINSSYNNPNSPELVATGTGMTQYRPCFLLNWGNTGGYVALTSEL